MATHKNCMLCENVAQTSRLPTFPGLGWLSVGEFFCFMIAFTRFVLQHSLVSRKLANTLINSRWVWLTHRGTNIHRRCALIACAIGVSAERMKSNWAATLLDWTGRTNK